MKQHVIFLTALLLGLPLATRPLAAQESSVPPLISYQGKLVQADGLPYADGNHAVTFKLYDAPTGGTLVWGATYTVAVVDGVFSVALGAPGGQPLDPMPPVTDLRFAFGSPERYLELSVAGSALLPRQQMTSVPYAINGAPTGSVMPFAGANIPAGWALCDGQPLDGNDPRYAALFDIIDKIYGPGDGSAKGFSLPDLRGRTAVGAGQSEGLTQRALASKFGAETHTLTAAQMPSHTHTGTTNSAGAHSHHLVNPNAAAVRWGDGGASDTRLDCAGSSYGSRGNITTNSAGAHTHTFTTNATGGGQAHNNMQPSLALNYIIKL